MSAKKNMNLQILVPLVFVLMVTVNALANILPINGIGTGEVSDKYGNLFAPAPITFGIWGVIYIFLLGFVVYYVLRINKVDESFKDSLNIVAWLFVVSSVANTVWMFAWHYDVIWLTVILMLVMLITLLIINEKLKGVEMNFLEKILIRSTFAMYFGWITVATIANITTFLVWTSWNGFGISQVVWTNLIFIVGAVIGFFTILRYRSLCYNLTLIWAYIGIFIKHVSKDGFAGEYISSVIAVSLSLLILIFAGVLLVIARSKKKIEVDL
jgi:hypothetical protein